MGYLKTDNREIRGKTRKEESLSCVVLLFLLEGMMMTSGGGEGKKGGQTVR
jgi:hypothetical protein